jgi:hypothetical protein
VRKQIFARDHANDSTLMWIANAQMSETLRAEDVKALFNTVVSLDHEGMFLNVRPHIYQLV